MSRVASVMVVRVVEFSSKGYRIGQIFAERWCNGKMSKLAKIFYVKNYQNRSHYFFIEEYQFRDMFFVIDIF